MKRTLILVALLAGCGSQPQPAAPPKIAIAPPAPPYVPLAPLEKKLIKGTTGFLYEEDVSLLTQAALRGDKQTIRAAWDRHRLVDLKKGTRFLVTSETDDARKIYITSGEYYSDTVYIMSSVGIVPAE